VQPWLASELRVGVGCFGLAPPEAYLYTRFVLF